MTTNVTIENDSCNIAKKEKYKSKVTLTPGINIPCYICYLVHLVSYGMSRESIADMIDRVIDKLTTNVMIENDNNDNEKWEETIKFAPVINISKLSN